MIRAKETIKALTLALGKNLDKAFIAFLLKRPESALGTAGGILHTARKTTSHTLNIDPILGVRQGMGMFVLGRPDRAPRFNQRSESASCTLTQTDLKIGV